MSRPAAAVVLALLVVAMGAGPASATTSDPSSERDSLARVNAARADHGLPAVRLDAGLSAIARDHSERMVGQGRLYHDSRTPDRAGDWLRYGENVGRGPSAGSIHVAFMRSDDHRRNILGSFRSIGVGAVRSGDTVWITQIFVTRPAPARATRTVPRARAPRPQPDRVVVRTAATPAMPVARAVERPKPRRDSGQARVMLDRLASLLADDVDQPSAETTDVPQRFGSSTMG